MISDDLDRFSWQNEDDIVIISTGWKPAVEKRPEPGPTDLRQDWNRK